MKLGVAQRRNGRILENIQNGFLTGRTINDRSNRAGAISDRSKDKKTLNTRADISKLAKFFMLGCDRLDNSFKRS
uniref:Uncharacterized protein n=1 Tax=Romanomermis culicivorax TaxID=13658 RepID=A0A915IQS0_ROMCU